MTAQSFYLYDTRCSYDERQGTTENHATHDTASVGSSAADYSTCENQTSSRQPDLDLEKVPACDNRPDGAYAFQAAFLFELFAFGLHEQNEVGLLYNSSISRVIP